MSLREEESDRERSGRPSRGLAVAAAAIGVGVGAALYYFFNKQPENRQTEDESAQEWRAERAYAFRQRSWSLEECSICFDIMLKDQSLTSLPCTHNFHADCIRRWLQEHNTCPNCRVPAAQH